MKTQINISKNQNYITFYLENGPSEVKIYDEKDKLIRISWASESYTFIGLPGTYSFEIDDKVQVKEIETGFRDVDRIKRIHVFNSPNVAQVGFVINGAALDQEQIQEKVNKKELKIEELQTALLEFNQQQSAQSRKALISEERIWEAALGILSEEETQAIRETWKAFKQERERLEREVRQVKDLDSLFNIQVNFPEKLIQKKPIPKPRKKKDELENPS